MEDFEEDQTGICSECGKEYDYTESTARNWDTYCSKACEVTEHPEDELW